VRAPSHHTDDVHHIHLVRRRGGETVPRALALTELARVYGPTLVVTDDARGQLPFVRAHFTIDDVAIAARAHRLGYTHAIVRVRTLAADVARATPAWNKRTRGVPTGAWRDAGAHVWMDPVVVIDDDNARDADGAPASGGVPPPEGGVAPPAPRRPLAAHRRRLSLLDARFIANVCALADGARVLDPFAGRGTLARALVHRALQVTTGDVDLAAAHAAARHAATSCAVHADARALPFDDDVFDGVVTEPPYRAHERAAVIASVRELVRVVRLHGVLALLIADGMCDDVTAALTVQGCVETERFALVRHGLACALLVARRAPR
jgi:hypothetical protein